MSIPPRLARVLLVVGAGSLLSAAAADAWTSRGHRLITRAAVEWLVDSGADWKPAERQEMVEASTLPDLMRPRQLPQLRDLEAPRHYIDLEVLGGRPLPPDHWRFVELLMEITEEGGGLGLLKPGGDLTQIGTLPYALVESTERLAAIFAVWRSRPEDGAIRSVAAYQAGRVAHYAQDLCQPLHTSIHHDGRARANGTSPQSGIHRKMDDVLTLVSVAPGEDWQRRPVDRRPLLPAIIAALEESHSQVDRVYELEPALEALHEKGMAAPDLVEFAGQRLQRAIGLTADLIHTAWLMSASLEVPSWAKPPVAPPPVAVE